MKERKLKYCPCCGSSNSMIYKKNLTLNLDNEDYKDILIDKLEGYICKVCNEVMYDNKSSDKIDFELAKQMALQDSKKVLVSEITTVEKMAKRLNKSKKKIDELMDKGLIKYVYIDDLRFPLKKEIDSNYLSLKGEFIK